MEVRSVKPDRAHIDLSDEDVVRHWTKKFGTTPEKLAAAIKKVGNNIASIERELGIGRP